MWRRTWNVSSWCEARDVYIVVGVEGNMTNFGNFG
jgi:hypothetical protein